MVSGSTARRMTRAIRVTGASALLAAAATLIAPGSVGAAEPGEPAADESQITITQKDSSVQGMCLPGALVLSYQKSDRAEYFELIVRASNPPCDPIDAKAAIYNMPGKGEAWPQKLHEVKPFTISKAGTTSIRFAKTCDPQQFDVLTGETPSTISPVGPWHGPLLFPGDVTTSLQHWGCRTPTTTTTTSTTTSTTTTTQPTTTTTEVAPTTTEVAPTTASTVPTTVLGVTDSRDPSNPGGSVGSGTDTQVAGKTDVKANNDKLAYTGGNSALPISVGSGLALGGIALLVVSRRRTASA